MLYNPIKRDWDRDIMAAFGLPEKIFPPIDMPGTMRGRLRSDIARELGINCAAFAAVGTHDTASAVAAIPGSGSFAFCSSGTWSVFGIETIFRCSPTRCGMQASPTRAPCRAASAR